MYTCSSQTLVHLFSSQVLLVVRHAFVLSLILNIGTGVLSVLFVYLFDLSSLHPLIRTCLSVPSVVTVVCPCSFISVGG